MSGAYYPPPPGVTIDPLPGDRRDAYPPGVQPPPAGVTVDQPSTLAAESSVWRRLAGMQPGALIPSATPDQGAVWPVRHTPEGIAFDPYAGLSGMFLRGITSPGDVTRGSLPITGPTGGINPELTNRALDFAQSVSLTNPASMAGERGFGPPVRTGPPQVPSATMLKQAANDQYDQIRGGGPDILSQAITDRARQASTDLSRKFDRESAPNVFSTLDAMLDPQSSWTSMTSLMARRDRLGELAGKGGTEGEAARQALAQVDHMISTQLDPSNTRMGYGGPWAPLAPGEVAPAMARADANWGAAQRANTLSGELDTARTGFIEKGEGRRGNFDLYSRRAAEKVLETDKEVKSLSPAERAALDYVNVGNWLRNKASDIGTSFGQSGLSKAVSFLRGGIGGGVLGALWNGLTPETGLLAGATAVAAPWVGKVARSVADSGARSAISAADELMRTRSPMYQEYMASRGSPLFSREQAIQSILQPGLLGALEYPQATPPKVERRLPAGYI